MATILSVYVYCYFIGCVHMKNLKKFEMSVCVYVVVVVEGMYTCKTGYFVKNPLCLCFCCCIGYVHMYDW